MKDLDTLRKTIDECDKEIVSAIEKRFFTVKEVIKYKKANNLEILQPDREKEVLEKIDSYLNSKEFSPELRSIFINIMALSKEIQSREK